MLRNSFVSKFASYLMLVVLPIVTVFASYAQAELINTEAVIGAEDGYISNPEKKLQNFLNRNDVRQSLLSYGLTPAEAQARVSSLSHEELQYLNSRIDTIPAGGDGLGSIVGAVVFIFVLLIITDIIGFTKVFPFTRSLR